MDSSQTHLFDSSPKADALASEPFGNPPHPSKGKSAIAGKLVTDTPSALRPGTKLHTSANTGSITNAITSSSTDIGAAHISQMKQLFISQYEMSLYERRLLLKMIEKLPEQLDSSGAIDFWISIDEIAQASNLKGESVYTQIQLASRELIRHVCQLKEQDGLLQVGLLSSAKYLKGQSLVSLRVDGRLFPYFSQIKKEFALGRLAELMSFQSYYTQCLYELFLREASDRDQFYITLTDLRKLLKVEDKYDRYADFRRRILLQAQSDLKDYENSAFLFKPVKERFTGKVIGIHFYFRKLLTSKTKPDT